MAKIKNIIKAIVPPILYATIQNFRKFDRTGITWSGDFKTWDDAEAECTGYDTDLILEECKNSMLKIKSGEAVYERDSVLFDEIHYNWGLVAGLQKAAMENNGELCVLDFGGSLGSSFYQNRDFLNLNKKLTWCIVEQENFVKCGKENFETEELKFYYDIEECLRTNKPNVILLGSVLQYLQDPYEWLERLIELNISYIIIDRTAFIDVASDLLTIQTVPDSIYKASYPAWFFSIAKFDHAIRKYQKIANFDSGYTPPMVINNKVSAKWSGLILRK
ncbi:MAG: TIGR04325 family methyltransferase [Pelobium sp.]